MARLSLFAALCSFLKKAFALIFSAAMLLCACGERNEGMLSLASEDVPYIYALGDRGGQAVLIISNENGYYREYPVSGAVAPYNGNVVCASQSGLVYIGQGNNILTASNNDYSSWSVQSLGFLIYAIATTPFGDYCLIDNFGDVLHRYEKSTDSWLSMGKATTGNDAEKMCYSRTYSALYINDNDAAFTYLFRVGTPSVLVAEAHYSINAARNFLAEVNGGFYIGNNVDGLYLNGVLIGAGSGLASYAVVSPSDIFAGTDSASLPLRVFRLIGGSFVQEIQFSGATGFIKLWPLPPDRIIIGVGDVSSSNGLYIYDFKKRSLKLVSSLSIYAVYSPAQ